MQNKRLHHGKNTGFTLIELLVVIAIITVLATYLMVNFLGFNCSARQAASKAAISAMSESLELFYADYGGYPKQAASNFSSSVLVEALKGDLTADPPKKQYYPFKRGETGQGGEWVNKLGFPYYYRNNNAENYSSKKPPPPDVRNISTFDIWSQDCKTPEGMTDPMQIAGKTIICNWE
ncbi:MAG: prepilin-type N-terminal cleavage/methylation domain-containing protein [Planctomycetes bacterium]|nr:prepilin-type N-terminal cleavage/methylation domain-containing protein [Planctomycetota bacterium]